LLRHSGRTADAAAVHSLVARQRALALGPGHRDTLVSRLGLALDGAEAGDLGPSSAALDRLLHDAETIFGPRDYLTTVIRAAAADIALALGRVDHAVTHLQLACSAMEALRGPAHPDSVVLQMELADAVAVQAAAPSGR
jgi:hypothetical protein